MIKGFVGIYGSGKTIWAIHDLQWYFKNGFTVYSNTPLWGFDSKGKKVMAEFIFNDKIIPWLAQLTAFDKPTVLFVDEASTVFDSQHIKDIPRETWEILKQSRKINLDILWTAQRYQDVATRIKENCAIIYECSKPDFFITYFYRAIGYHPYFFKDNAKSTESKQYILRRRLSIPLLFRDYYKFYSTAFPILSEQAFKSRFGSIFEDPRTVTPELIKERSKSYKPWSAPL